MDNSKQARGWCFTINNYTDQDTESMPNVPGYVIYGREVAPETGTPHLQGFAYFPNKATFKKVKALFPRAHIEIMKGTAEQAIVYCKKEGNFTEHGEPPSQGKRKDLDIIKDKIKNNEVVRMRDVTLEAKSLQSIKVAEVLLKYHEIKRTWKPYVKWLHGPTGTGKTRTAMEELGDDVYVAMESNKWWEGYDAHENVLIDDMRKDFCKFHVLLRLLDRYEFRLENKGGSRQFLAKKIYITSCHHPSSMFDTREDVQQLLRRIDEIVEIL